MVLNFSTEVAEYDSISLIQNAIVDGKLGELSVWYIIGTPAPSIPMTTLSTLARITPGVVVCVSFLLMHGNYILSFKLLFCGTCCSTL